MPVTEFQVSHQKVSCYFDMSFSKLGDVISPEKIILITDEHIDGLYRSEMSAYRKIVIPPGEPLKTRDTADNILDKLIEMEADRSTLLLAVGGGVVTDLAGYAAAVYKRGIQLGLVPTTVLGMVDAAIGGKNGVNAGLFKNIIGTIHQPKFIFFDYEFLRSLPQVEWESGFAEIIKHACIRDKLMFETLERFTLHDYQADFTLLAELIRQNVELKMSIVQADEKDQDQRLLLNFGHTIGHAIENLHGLPHGHAISIGMVAACQLSEKAGRLHYDDAKKVVRLLDRYHLPVDIDTDPTKVFEILKMDKKRDQGFMNFIMLEGIGHGLVVPVELKFLEENMASVL